MNATKAKSTKTAAAQALASATAKYAGTSKETTIYHFQDPDSGVPMVLTRSDEGYDVSVEVEDMSTADALINAVKMTDALNDYAPDDLHEAARHLKRAFGCTDILF